MRTYKLVPHKKSELTTAQNSTKKELAWQITAFDIEAQWKYSQGDGIRVAVLDTGVDLDHTDLCKNIIPGHNFLENGLPEDDFDHGTHVSGIICASNTERIIGVAPRAKVIPVKVLNEYGIGILEHIVQGIDYAIEQKADIICMSLGSPRPTASLRRAIQRAYKKNIPIFCAAGNVRTAKDVMYPACYPETISVGAIDKNFHLADFSSTGPNLDFLAPGVDIISTVRNNWYAKMSGSSMANAFASGVAALLLSYEKTRGAPILDVEFYRNILAQHAMKLPDYPGDSIFGGFGIIDPKSVQSWWISRNNTLDISNLKSPEDRV